MHCHTAKNRRNFQVISIMFMRVNISAYDFENSWNGESEISVFCSRAAFLFVSLFYAAIKLGKPQTLWAF